MTGTVDRVPRRLAVLLGVLTALLAAAQLLTPPAIGLADNGDSFRLTCQLGVQADVAAPASPWFMHWVPDYRPQDAGAPECVGLASSQLPLLELAQALSPGAGADLDLRVVGALHAALLGLLVGAVVLGLPGPPRLRLLCGGLLALVLLDTGRLVYLATAYSEPVSLLGLLALLATALWAFRRPAGWLTSAAVCVAALPLVLSKPQNAPAAAVVAAAVLLRVAARGSSWRRLVVPAAAALALVGVAGWALRQVPPDLTRPNAYNVVFFEVLRFSPDPARDAAELGLDPELARWAGTDYFNSPNARADPAFAGFYDIAGPRAVALFYARHPDRALSLYARAARSSFDLLPGYLGTYPASAGRADFAQACRGCPVTRAGAATRDAAPVLLPLLWLGAALAALALLRRRGAPADRALAGTTLLLTAVTTVLFAAATLGGGDYELTKHLFLPGVGSTLLLPLGVAAVVRLRAQAGGTPVAGPGSVGTAASPGGSRSRR